MTPQARPNLGGLFNGSTPADRVSSIAGRLGPRLVTAPVAQPGRPAVSAPNAIGSAGDAKDPTADGPAASPPGTGSMQGPVDPLAWFDPIRALELYFGVLQAVFDVNRQCVMGLATVLVTGGTRLRNGVGSSRTSR